MQGYWWYLAEAEKRALKKKKIMFPFVYNRKDSFLMVTVEEDLQMLLVLFYQSGG